MIKYQESIHFILLNYANKIEDIPVSTNIKIDYTTKLKYNKS